MSRLPPLRFLFVALSALLAGCGFHLAGSRPLPEPLKKVRIDMVTEYEVGESPLEEALRDRLQGRGGQVTSKLKDGVTVIRLTELKETRQVLSVGSDGKALEYELITRVTFDARTGTNLWQPPVQIEARQPYSFSAQQVLAKEQEADRLRGYLQDELAEILLLRLEAAASRVALPEAKPDVVPPVNPPVTPPGMPQATLPGTVPVTPPARQTQPPAPPETPPAAPPVS